MRIRRHACLRLIIAGVALLLLPAHAAMQQVDERGKVLTLSKPATRIISLAPHITELVFAVGAGGKLVGVSSYSDYPPAAKRISVIGDGGKIDLERVVQLRPDLVIAWQSGNHIGDIAQLERLGIPVFVTEPRRLVDIPKLLRTFGQLTGNAGQAEQSAAAFEKIKHALASRYSNAAPVSVFYEIWHQPLMTVNSDHMISDVISLCGGRNIFGSVRLLTPTVSMESVLAADPQAIIASGALYQDAGAWQDWLRFKHLSAVKHHHLFLIHPDLIQRQTPRILQGAELICRQLDQVRHAPR